MRFFVNFLESKTLLCLLLILLVGCATSMPPRFYLLSPQTNVSGEVQCSADTSCVSIGIGPVGMPEYTNRPQIITRTSQNELSLAQFDLWAEPLPDTFSRVIAENLAQLLCTKRVYLFPWRSSIKPDYIVEAEVIEMNGDLGTKAFLSVQWAIWRVGESKELVQKRTTYSEPVRDRTYNGLVQAYSNMVGQLSRDIAKGIEGL